MWNPFKTIMSEEDKKEDPKFRYQKLSVAYIIKVKTDEVKKLNNGEIFIKEHYQGPIKYENVYNYILYKSLMYGLYSESTSKYNDYNTEQISFPVKKHWSFDKNGKTNVFTQDFTFYYKGNELKGECVIKIKPTHPSTGTKMISRKEKYLLKKVFKEEFDEVNSFIE
ncbi:M protein [Menghai virus]|uniref:M protein n=1 Tax=Menghai virus TaxID=1919071 RepID=A0A1L2YVH5_9RHAB|nr:M protein [Menghai virus]APF29057.1 M protein [Menghai virus]